MQIPIRKKKTIYKDVAICLRSSQTPIPSLLPLSLSLSLITVSKKNNNAKQATIFLLIRIFFKKEKNKKALNYSELINTST